jgi:glycosyltransferase involved in cell wall biosynthesis
MAAPDVSVVIPTYNCGPYIADAIESALSQQSCQLEVIVVDDGSSDDTESRCRAWPSVRYLRTPRNLGPAGARNCGIRAATGRYVAFLDADDAWLPGKLVAQLLLLEREPQCVGASGLMTHWEQTEPPPVPDKPPYDIWTAPEMVQKNPIATPTVVVRRQAVESSGGFDEGLRICEDYDLWLRLAQQGPFARLRVPVARYRTRPDGASAGNRQETYRKHCEYVKSIPARFATIPRVRQAVRKHLAYIDMDHSFSALNELYSPRKALVAVLKSYLQWPLPLVIQGQRFPRMKRFAYLLGCCLRGKAI